MVHLEPASPVPSQSLAWHLGSRGHISSCDLKIPKELVPTSQSGYQVSFSINLLFIEKMRLLQLLWVMKARERRLPTASASPPSSAFSVCTICMYPILIPASLCEEHAHTQTLGMPSTSQELPTISSSTQGKGTLVVCLATNAINFSSFQTMRVEKVLTEVT